MKYIPLNSLTLQKHHSIKNGEGSKNKLWWENLPAKRKDKNKVAYSKNGLAYSPFPLRN
jgi:hypothetical protein